MKRAPIAIFGLVLAAFAATAVWGQAYPAKTIRIMTTPAGGFGDFSARYIAQGISGPLGQPVIIENYQSNLVGGLAVKAAPDGYTLVHSGTSFMFAPLLRTMPYDVIKDFAPITLAVKSVNVLVVHPSLPVKSVKDLLALAKAKPGALNYGSGSAGSSSHLAAELFNSIANVHIVRIPYRGVGPALLGLLGGHVQVMFPSASSALPYMKSGKVRALAVASAKPSALVPGLPTVASAGVADYEADTPLGVFMPAGAAPRVIERFNQVLGDVLNIADVRKLVTAQGSEVVASTPAEFAATLRSEIARWSKLIKAKGLRED